MGIERGERVVFRAEILAYATNKHVYPCARG